MDDLTPTTGIVALAAAGVALIALFVVARARALGCAACAPTSGRPRRQLAADLVAHAAELDRGFASLTTTSRTSPRASTRG